MFYRFSAVFGLDFSDGLICTQFYAFHPKIYILFKKVNLRIHTPQQRGRRRRRKRQIPN
jgi:hypothetical protein